MTKIHGRDGYIGRREATGAGDGRQGPAMVAGDGRQGPAMVAGDGRRKATVAGDGSQDHRAGR